MIRLTVIAAAAALLLAPIAAQACAGAHAAKITSTDYAAKTKKHVRKAAKMKKDKGEYMRAAPMK